MSRTTTGLPLDHYGAWGGLVQPPQVARINRLFGMTCIDLRTMARFDKAVPSPTAFRLIALAHSRRGITVEVSFGYLDGPDKFDPAQRGIVDVMLFRQREQIIFSGTGLVFGLLGDGHDEYPLQMDADVVESMCAVKHVRVLRRARTGGYATCASLEIAQITVHTTGINGAIRN